MHLREKCKGTKFPNESNFVAQSQILSSLLKETLKQYIEVYYSFIYHLHFVKYFD